MPLKCRCVCGCKLMVSLGSVGRSIKCPQCDRRLRVPKDAIERRQKQLAKKQAATTPEPARSKIETRLSSLVDVPDPEPPPIFEPEVGQPQQGAAEEPREKEADKPRAEDRSEQKVKKRTKERQDQNPRKPQFAPPSRAGESGSKEPPTETKAKDKPAADAIPKPPPRPRTTPDPKPVRDEARKERKASPDPEPMREAATTPSVREKSESDWSALGGAPRVASEPSGKARPNDHSLGEQTEPPSTKTEAQPQSVAAFSEPEVPETQPPPLQSLEQEDLPVHGYQADRDKVATVRWLATALLATAVFGMIPAGREIAQHFQLTDGPPLHRWVYASLLICGLQLAYAGYLVQLPDWSSVWVVTIFSLIVASAYAAMLCLTLLGGADSQFVQLLDLADRLRGGKATGWCFVMLCITGLLAYTTGRVGSRWRQSFAM